MTASITGTYPEQLLLPGQAAAPPGPVDAIGMYVMHHAFRRDVAAFTAAVARTPIEDRATWRALAERWRKFFAILHKHHSAEDAGLWPAILSSAKRAGDAAGTATLEAMEAEHAGIDPLLESCTAGFERLAADADADARDALEVRVVAVAELLRQHLAHEERDAMALVQRYLTPADWGRVEREHFTNAYGLAIVPFMLPWTLHDLPAGQLARVLNSLIPLPLRLAWRLFFRRPFERRERIAFRCD